MPVRAVRHARARSWNELCMMRSSTHSPMRRSNTGGRSDGAGNRMGPLVSDSQWRNVKSLVMRALSEGAA
jgi:hypothetical protein